MDRIDKKILKLLQEDGQMSNQQLADRVALSPSPCLRRVKNLEDKGYIKKYVAVLDTRKIGLDLKVLVFVSLEGHAAMKMARFEKKMLAFPEVTQCYLVTSQSADYVLEVLVPSMDHYQDFLLKKLTLIEGVASVHSSFVLRSVVDRDTVPLQHIDE